MDIFSFISLIGGLTFFLFGMRVMSANLEKLAGGRLEASLQKVVGRRSVSIALGAVITIAMQSSSATTVMLVGLVNSGIMQFSQTIGIIFGANIGTTLTAWILSLSGIESENFWLMMLKPENFSPILAFIGILMLMFSKDGRKKSVGNVLVGFAVLMFGMELMKDAVSPLAAMPEFAALLVKFRNPFFGVLIGTLFTAVIQSSAASIAILQALSLSGAITLGMAIPIVFGQNIGTCATSLISSIGASKNAKRVAFIHVLIKIIGTVIFLIVLVPLEYVAKAAFLDYLADPVSIALIHTVFNVALTVVLLPFSDRLVKLVTKLIKVDGEGEFIPTEDVISLDERLLRSPSIAIAECNNATVKMANLARANLSYALSLLTDYSPTTEKIVLQTEDELDICEDKLGTYLVKLSASAVSDRDSKTISKMLHVIGDFERMGDHAVNMQKVAKEMTEKRVRFSGAEFDVLNRAIGEILDLTVECYETDSVEKAAMVEPLEQVIDSLISHIRNHQIDQLQHGHSTIETGFILSDLLTNYERVSDHCSNIAVAVIEVEHGSFDTHKYLNGVKFGDSEFNKIYDMYSAKYSL